MRTLITGATGLLGCTLAPFLSAQGHIVIRHGYSTAADFTCDLTNLDETEAMLQAIVPDNIINLVGATNVDECERNLHAAYSINVRTVENLVSGLTKRKNAFLVHISTDQVYDSPGDSDETEVRLTNTYAMSKYASELAALRMSAAVLRTNFFGPSLHPFRRSFSDWLLDNLSSGKSFTAFTDVEFSPLLMDTLCMAIHKVMKQQSIGIYNVGSSQGMSKYDFATALAKNYNLPLTSMQAGTTLQAKLTAYRSKNMCMDSSKFEQTFGVKLPCLIDEIKRLRHNNDEV